MFIAALFLIAKTWEQPKCPWWKCKDLVHTMEYYLAIKMEWNNAICNNMDESGDYHTKCSKSDKDKSHMISLICGI